jgi:hypothetical protein
MMARWRLNKGLHVDKRATLVAEGELPEGVERKAGTFYPGDVFDLNVDLTKLNVPGARPRFTRMPDAEPAAAK